MPGIIQWIVFKEKQILFNDRSNLRSGDIALNVKEIVHFIKTSGKHEILYLVDNTNNIITPELKDLIKQSGIEIDPYIRKSAVVGTNQAQKLLINILSRLTKMPIRVFDSLEEAKNWLIE
jgi:hypothetical protein